MRSFVPSLLGLLILLGTVASTGGKPLEEVSVAGPSSAGAVIIAAPAASGRRITRISVHELALSSQSAPAHAVSCSHELAPPEAPSLMQPTPAPDAP